MSGGIKKKTKRFGYVVFFSVTFDFLQWRFPISLINACVNEQLGLLFSFSFSIFTNIANSLLTLRNVCRLTAITEGSMAGRRWRKRPPHLVSRVLSPLGCEIYSRPVVSNEQKLTLTTKWHKMVDHWTTIFQAANLLQNWYKDPKNHNLSSRYWQEKRYKVWTLVFRITVEQ